MEEDIGRALREARKAQGISLRALAAETGISASLLSQVENGKSQPSVSTLYTLVSRLRISLDDLLGLDADESPEPSPQQHDAEPAGANRAGLILQRAAENPVLTMDGGVRWERLASFDDGLVEALLVTYPGGASSSVEGTLMRHSGFEFAYLLEGSLTLALEFDRYRLGAGDSFCFDSTRPHMYVNQGREKARGLWYVVGRNAADHTRERLADLLGRVAGDSAANPANVVEVFRRLGAEGLATDG
ncbi:helix-turn-helix domain-containing protein [Streptomyces sp. NPDC056503]|uniref:helix-turn-helix domain-containing protein n=1 Tax=Streptomyces sp. NPDC056503 TaxID=3345842 RepID=UPI0036C3C5E8